MQCKAAAFESGSPSCPRAQGLQGGSGGSWRCDDALGGSEHWGGAAEPAQQPAAHQRAIPFLQEDKKEESKQLCPFPTYFTRKQCLFSPSFSPVLIPMHPPPFPCSFCVFSFMSIGQHFPWGRSKNQPNTHPARSSVKNHSSSVLWHSPQTGSISPPQLPQAPNQAQPEQLQSGEGLELSFLEVTDGKTQIPAFGGADQPPD